MLGSVTRDALALTHFIHAWRTWRRMSLGTHIGDPHGSGIPPRASEFVPIFLIPRGGVLYGAWESNQRIQTIRGWEGQSCSQRLIRPAVWGERPPIEERCVAPPLIGRVLRFHSARACLPRGAVVLGCLSRWRSGLQTRNLAICRRKTFHVEHRAAPIREIRARSHDPSC